MEDEPDVLETKSSDPLHSLGPFVLVGYLLTRPPVLAVIRFLVWIAIGLFRPIHFGFTKAKACLRRKPKTVAVAVE